MARAHLSLCALAAACSRNKQQHGVHVKIQSGIKRAAAYHISGNGMKA